MGELAFAGMCSNLQEQLVAPQENFVTAIQYQQWQQDYIFDALKNQRYGQSFCNKFDVTDNILFYERDWVRADTYIRKHYIVR